MAFLSNFLEKMDQSAGEIAQDLHTPSTSGKLSASALSAKKDDLISDSVDQRALDTPSPRPETTDVEDVQDMGSGIPPPVESQSHTGPPDDKRCLQAQSGASAALEKLQDVNDKQKKKITELELHNSKALRSSENALAKHEATMKERDQRFGQLQSDYDICMSRLKEIQQGAALKEQTVIDIKNQNHVLADREVELIARLEEKESRLEVARDQICAFENQIQDLQTHVQVGAEEKYAVESAGKQALGQVSKLTLELTDYRAKAQALLAEKDKTIDYLRGGSGNIATNDVSGDSLKTLQEELAAVKLQRSKDVGALNLTCQELTSEREKKSLQVEILEKDARTNREAVQEAQHTAHAANALYDGEVASHASTRQHLEGELALKEGQLQKMRLKVAAATSAVASGTPINVETTPSVCEHPTSTSTATNAIDLERRVKDLSELVMEKQAALEAKRSESEQWKTRCEMTQQRLREAEMVSSLGSNGGATGSNLGLHRTSGHRVVSIEDDRDVQDSLQGDFTRSNFFGGLQRRGAWGQKVVGVAQQLDSVSLTTGGMLKRNSVLRVALILYVLLLHVWVFVVLSFTGTGADNSIGTTPSVVEPKA